MTENAVELSIVQHQSQENLHTDSEQQKAEKKVVAIPVAQENRFTDFLTKFFNKTLPRDIENKRREEDRKKALHSSTLNQTSIDKKEKDTQVQETKIDEQSKTDQNISVNEVIHPYPNVIKGTGILANFLQRNRPNSWESLSNAVSSLKKDSDERQKVADVLNAQKAADKKEAEALDTDENKEHNDISSVAVTPEEIPKPLSLEDQMLMAIPSAPPFEQERKEQEAELIKQQQNEKAKKRKKIPSPREIINRVNQSLQDKEIALYVKWVQEGANPYDIPMTQEMQEKFIDKIKTEHLVDEKILAQLKSHSELRRFNKSILAESSENKSSDDESSQSPRKNETEEEKKRKFLQPAEIRKRVKESLKNQEAELYINWIVNGTNPYLLKMRPDISDTVFEKLKTEYGYTDYDLSRLKRESIRPKARLVLPFTESQLPDESELKESLPQETKEEEPEDRLKQVNETFRNLEAAYFIKWVLEGANPYLLTMTTEVTDIVMKELKNKYGFDDGKLKNLEIQARLSKNI